jgi:hypothetical protein
MNQFRRIDACRVCGNSELVPVLSLGDQYLTGVFPKTREQAVTHGPLELARCAGDPECCGLVQLRHSYDPGEMYGPDYGYRSSLNRSMVTHLQEKARLLSSMVPLVNGDLVLDIGSNDGTLLSFFAPNLERAGMDPSAAMLRNTYPAGAHCIVDFFSRERFADEFGATKAKIITSIAMFYDLDNPQQFANDVADSLEDDGIWHFEQSYMPLMLDVTGYDTICHEHVEYYGLHQIEWLLKRAGLRVLNVELNQVNGGSFAVTACKADSPFPTENASVDAIRNQEKTRRLDSEAPFRRFSQHVHDHRARLIELLASIADRGEKVIGYGASTKGNVILQYCGITPAELPCIAEVNADKFGSFTPGTLIPIISEAEARAMNPDYFFAMPWHFRSNLIEREARFLASGGKMIFPLPELEVVGGVVS